MSLIKKAEGLPKFTLTCGFWRSRKAVGMSLAAIGLKACGVSYCYEHGIDGKLPKGHENIAAAFGLKAAQVKAAMKELLTRDIWREHEEHIEIVNFLEHNPSRADVQEYRRKREQAASKANHSRWHKETKDPECEWCVAESESDPPDPSESESESDPESNGSRTPNVEESRERNAEDVTDVGKPPRQLQDFYLSEPFARARDLARKNEAFGKCPHGKPEVSYCENPDCQSRAEIVMRRYLDEEVPA